MGCNTKGVGCINIKGVGCIIKGVGCIPRVYGCNIKGVWGVNILFLLCDIVIHLGYNGDKFFR